MCQQWQTGPYNETQCDECIFTVIPVKELPGYYFILATFSCCEWKKYAVWL